MFNMMKITQAIIAISLVTNAHAAENTQSMKLFSIESRESGSHALYFTGSIPNQGCTLSDRAVIVESSPGGGTMLQVAFTALTTRQLVIARVDGCVPINPPDTTITAPKVTKLQIYYAF